MLRIGDSSIAFPHNCVVPSSIAPPGPPPHSFQTVSAAQLNEIAVVTAIANTLPPESVSAINAVNSGHQNICSVDQRLVQRSYSNNQPADAIGNFCRRLKNAERQRKYRQSEANRIVERMRNAERMRLKRQSPEFREKQRQMNRERQRKLRQSVDYRNREKQRHRERKEMKKLQRMLSSESVLASNNLLAITNEVAKYPLLAKVILEKSGQPNCNSLNANTNENGQPSGVSSRQRRQKSLDSKQKQNARKDTQMQCTNIIQRHDQRIDVNSQHGNWQQASCPCVFCPYNSK